MPTPPKKKKGRGKTVTTPEKAKISRYYQKLGGEETRGAAVRTARKFGLTGSNGPARVKKYDEEVARNQARRKSVPGRPSTFNDDIAKEIDSAFKAKEDQTYRRAAKTIGMPKSTLHRHATKKLGYRCLKSSSRPFATEKQLEQRVEMGQSIVAVGDGPVKNEFHQDEKPFLASSGKRFRKVRKADKVGSARRKKAPSRRHQTKVMFSGCVGVGPTGVPIKIHFEWVSAKKKACKGSKYHKKGDIYFVSTTMDAAYFRDDLRKIGKKIRDEYAKLGYPSVRVKLQIDSAGGHGLARGHGNFEELRAMMLKDFNIELVQQVGNTPMYNVLDLSVWRSIEVEVDNMDDGSRYREDELVKVCKKAWRAMEPVKILFGFEMRKDCAREAIANGGLIDGEGKGRGGSKRVLEGAQYAQLRAHLKI